jgi:hypothetical protein
MAGIVTDVPSTIGNYLAQNKGNIQPLNIGAVSGLIPADHRDDRLLRARPANSDHLFAAQRRRRVYGGRRRTCRQGEHGGHDPDL